MPLGTKSNTLTGAQVRGARALLNWSGDRLAQESGVSLQTIRRAESNDEPLRMIPANAQAIRSALEAGGIQFIPENGGGPGVRLRKSPPVKRVRFR
jgi:transcriptional regulator with XRE-family HTH domain